MVKAWVLIATVPGKYRAVYNELGKDLSKSKPPRVERLDALFGEYDMGVIIETEDDDKIGAYVVDRIRKIDGVKDTKTLRVINYR